MPELVADGPAIPANLMNEQDMGTVVFFCGAGISAGPGSELPGFAKLVQHVYTANNLEPDAVEREALDLDERDSERRRPKLDKALDLLERPERLGASALRQTIIERLSCAPTGPLKVHEALIALSRRDPGVRLITTNFDNRFVDAGLAEESIDAAPKLPIPKRHSWSSLVHLHGRIVPGDDGTNLVLAAADFGRAYLTERWAARFVTELFREFTVVFVGYSVSDPVMGYMVDALAAERAKGAGFARAYAFADHDGTSTGKQKASDGWLAKNVQPVLYDRREDHRLLGETLVEWARVQSDPFRARSRIAIEEMTKMPSGPDDPIVERVVWALQDPVAASALANEPPVKDEADFPKIEKWLEIFAERGLLRSAAGDADPPSLDQDPAFVRLVDSGLQLVTPQTVDMTRAHLACWLAGHVHVPQVLAWALRTGGHMHPVLRGEILRRLADENLGIPSRLRVLWTVLMDHEARDPWRFLWTPERYKTADSEAERLLIEDEAVNALAPRLEVRRGPGWGREFQQSFDRAPKPIPPVDACGHLRLVSVDEETWHQVKEILEKPEVLARHAETLTRFLEQALVLGKQDDEMYGDSYRYRPSIAAHDQNQEHDDWTRLIDLVRDGYLALAATHRARADSLLGRWALSKESLFKRLVLHALTENPKSDIRLARKLLVAGRAPGVWEFDLQREVLRFFRKAGRRLPRSLRAEVVRAIHAGPKSGKGQTWRDDPQILRREKALRLQRLAASGARLDKKSRELAGEAERERGSDDRDEFHVWQSKGHWIGDEEIAPKNLLEGSLSEVVTIIENDKIRHDAFRRFTSVQPVKAVSVLRRLAQRGNWTASVWQGFLWGLDGQRQRPRRERRMREYVACILSGAPGGLFGDVGSAAAGFVKDLAEQYGVEREQELCAIWMKAWGGIATSGSDDFGINETLSRALNHAAGKLAEAALIRLWKYEPPVASGLPPAVRPYFEAIGRDPHGLLGRVMLATSLHRLFVIDPDWSREHLIARLRPSSSNEAGPLWSAYGWSPSVGPDLLRAFKESFLDVLCVDHDLGRSRNKLVALFMTICLEAPDELATEEIKRVVESMPEDSLQVMVRSLGRRLTGSEDHRAQIWRGKIAPWLQKHWPRLADRNTAKTSFAILQMLLECGDAFADAADWSRRYLRPLDGHGLIQVGRSEHVRRNPEAMLDVLDRVSVEDILPASQRHFLRAPLDAMAAASPDLRSDARFQRLYKLAAR